MAVTVLRRPLIRTATQFIWHRESRREIQHVIDMRSDTVTKPTPGMYAAMVSAPLGDDVFGDDPVTKKLEDRCASLFAKEAALFVTSGTMGNLLSMMTHCNDRGCEILVGDKSHICLFEQGGVSQLAGIHSMALRNLPDGTLDLEEVESKIRYVNDIHQPITKVVCLENTQNFCGGVAISPEYFHSLRALMSAKGLKVHMDGARLFNACTAVGVSPSEYTSHVDSVNVCFSKGLGAPFGSVIAASAEFISRARRYRKALGGGLRQSGLLAAAALYALDNNVPELERDHKNAKRLAQVIKDCDSSILTVNLDNVQTNIVIIRMMNPSKLNSSQFAARMAQVTEDERTALGAAIVVKLAKFFNEGTARFVTHLGLSDQDVDLAERKFTYVMRELSKNL